MTQTLLWKRDNWRIYRIDHKKLRVENIKSKEIFGFAVHKTHWGYPLNIQWEHNPEKIPEYVTHAVIMIYKREVPKRLLR